MQPDSKKHGLRGVLEKTETQKKLKNFEEKFGDLKIMRTFAAPFEKRVLARETKISSLKRLLTVQEASTEKQNKFIEKR